MPFYSAALIFLARDPLFGLSLNLHKTPHVHLPQPTAMQKFLRQRVQIGGGQHSLLGPVAQPSDQKLAALGLSLRYSDD